MIKSFILKSIIYLVVSVLFVWKLVHQKKKICSEIKLKYRYRTILLILIQSQYLVVYYMNCLFLNAFFFSLNCRKSMSSARLIKWKNKEGILEKIHSRKKKLLTQGLPLRIPSVLNLSIFTIHFKVLKMKGHNTRTEVHSGLKLDGKCI